jgi:hypothetical protein
MCEFHSHKIYLGGALMESGLLGAFYDMLFGKDDWGLPDYRLDDDDPLSID